MAVQPHPDPRMAEAVRWYRESAEQGYPEGQFNLGRVYQFGLAVPQDRQEAIR